MTDDTCGHCGKPFPSASRGTAADGTELCHTGTVPPSDEPRDCYRLVTIYQHEPDGMCCRTDWYPSAEEAYELGADPDVRVDIWTSWPSPAQARATHMPSGTIAVAVGPMADIRARFLLARKLGRTKGSNQAASE